MSVSRAVRPRFSPPRLLCSLKTRHNNNARNAPTTSGKSAWPGTTTTPRPAPSRLAAPFRPAKPPRSTHECNQNMKNLDPEISCPHPMTWGTRTIPPSSCFLLTSPSTSVHHQGRMPSRGFSRALRADGRSPVSCLARGGEGPAIRPIPHHRLAGRRHSLSLSSWPLR